MWFQSIVDYNHWLLRHCCMTCSSVCTRNATEACVVAGWCWRRRWRLFWPSRWPPARPCCCEVSSAGVMWWTRVSATWLTAQTAARLRLSTGTSSSSSYVNQTWIKVCIKAYANTVCKLKHLYIFLFNSIPLLYIINVKIQFKIFTV